MLYIEIPVYQNSTRQDLSSKVMFDTGSLWPNPVARVELFADQGSNKSK